MRNWERTILTSSTTASKYTLNKLHSISNYYFSSEDVSGFDYSKYIWSDALSWSSKNSDVSHLDLNGKVSDITAPTEDKDNDSGHETVRIIDITF